MCFSEEASFTAAVAIGIVAGAALHTAGFTRFAFLALAPLFFALQQLAEGLTWLHLKGVLSDGWLPHIMREYYNFFAFVGWPIWVPFSLLIVEKESSRRLILSVFLLFGVLIGGYNLFQMIEQPIYPVVASHSIRYETQIPYQEVYLYGAITLLPWFFSSLRGAWVAALVFIFSFLIAGYFYEFTFTSVWCFFAAIVSIVILKVLTDNIDCIDASKTFK
jgi:hypothetical protein